MIDVINGEVLGIPRILYAGAPDGLIPSFLFKVYPFFATSHYAILTYTLSCFILSVKGCIQQLLVLSSASILLINLGVVLSVIKFRLQKNIYRFYYTCSSDFYYCVGIIKSFQTGITWLLYYAGSSLSSLYTDAMVEKEKSRRLNNSFGTELLDLPAIT